MYCAKRFACVSGHTISTSPSSRRDVWWRGKSLHRGIICHIHRRFKPHRQAAPKSLSYFTRDAACSHRSLEYDLWRCVQPSERERRKRQRENSTPMIGLQLL